MGWCLAGVAWTLQNFLPWTSTGMLAHTSPVEGAGLVQDGVLGDRLVPLAGAVLVLPVAGLVLVALTAVESRTRWRVSVWSLGAVASLWASLALAGASPERFGPGAWCALVGCVLPLAALRPPTRRPLVPEGAHP